MDVTEVATRLSVADADVHKIEQHPDGLVVTLADGQRRLLTEVGWVPFTGEIPCVVTEEDDEPVVDPEVCDRSARDEVPTGNAGEVLKWVGNDYDRVIVALQAEEQRELPRKGLMAALQKLVEPAE